MAEDDFAFTYSGSSVSAAFVAGVFNEQFRIAKLRLDESDRLTSEALAMIPNAPQASEVDIGALLDIPEAPVIEGFTEAQLTNLYQSTADEIKALLANGLTEFLTVYFPLGNELASARAWVENAIVNGGTGIAPAVEDQIWQRDRSRVLRDAARATDEQTAMWAARGYPLPPGALVHAVATIDQDARDKIAQASRDVAIKQADIELENIRLAIDKALTLRTAAIQSAGDYIKTLALGPQISSQLAMSMVESRTKMAQALTSFYQAQIAAVELPARVAIADANADVEIRKANISAETDVIKARVALIADAARQYGTQAAAAMNALNAGTSIGGRENM